MDDRLGVFGRPAEGDLGQLPLHVCQIEVSDPVGLLGRRPDPLRVFGTGLDFASARLAAGLNAFSAYGALMLDPRRLVGTDHEPIFARTVDPELALRDDGVRAAGHVRGWAVKDGRIRLVPASRAFPVLGCGHRAGLLPSGVASAYGWEEAVTTGALAQIRRLTLDEMATARQPSPRLDLYAAPLDPVGARYRAILAAVSEEVVAYDVTGTLSVPTVLCQVGREARGCASGLSMAAALRDALGEAIVSYQSSLHDQPAYAPPPIPAPPIPAPWSPPGRDHRRSGSDPLDLDAIAAILTAHGRELVAVPLDHDPEVSAVMPNTVHVVVARA